MTKNVLFLTVLLGLTSKIQSDGELGEDHMALGENRYVQVQEFKGRILVDIREYYQSQDGITRPRKKGIALTPAQWAVLKNFTPQIDAEVDRLQKSVPSEKGAPAGGGGNADHQDLPF